MSEAPLHTHSLSPALSHTLWPTLHYRSLSLSHPRTNSLSFTHSLTPSLPSQVILLNPRAPRTTAQPRWHNGSIAMEVAQEHVHVHPRGKQQRRPPPCPRLRPALIPRSPRRRTGGSGGGRHPHRAPCALRLALRLSPRPPRLDWRHPRRPRGACTVLPVLRARARARV